MQCLKWGEIPLNNYPTSFLQTENHSIFFLNFSGISVLLLSLSQEGHNHKSIQYNNVNFWNLNAKNEDYFDILKLGN